MVYYDKINVSKGMDLNKASASFVTSDIFR